MNKHFFKIENDIYVKDILKILNISDLFFLKSNIFLDSLTLLDAPTRTFIFNANIFF